MNDNEPISQELDESSDLNTEESALQRIEYKTVGDRLQFVHICRYSVAENGAIDTARHIDAYDRKMSNDYCEDWMNPPRPTSWKERAKSTRFVVAWPKSEFGNCGCEWECSINEQYLLDYLYLVESEEDLQEVEAFISGKRDPYSSWPSSSLAAILVAYVEHAMAQDKQAILTPKGAELHMMWFLEELVQFIHGEWRRSYLPNMLRLCRSARASAEMTPTGIDALDAILGGGLAPGVYTLAGDPSAGKTALAVQMLLYAAHNCKQHERAVYFMADQGGEGEIAKRLTSLAHAINRDAKGEPLDGCELSRSYEWTDEELTKAVVEYEFMADGRAVLVGLTNGSFSDMTDVLDKLTTRADVHLTLVVVDYYQLLVDMKDGCTVASDPEYASLVMRNLRTWATDHRTPVLLVGQFTKEAIERHRRGNPAEMTDLLGSVDVPYQSEACIMLTNAHDGSGIVTLTDAKHRHAGNASQDERSARLHLDGEHGYFFETR